jgi:hypothetical protein
LTFLTWKKENGISEENSSLLFLVEAAQPTSITAYYVQNVWRAIADIEEFRFKNEIESSTDR